MIFLRCFAFRLKEISAFSCFNNDFLYVDINLIDINTLIFIIIIITWFSGETSIEIV